MRSVKSSSGFAIDLYSARECEHLGFGIHMTQGPMQSPIRRLTKRDIVRVGRIRNAARLCRIWAATIAVVSPIAPLVAWALSWPAGPIAAAIGALFATLVGAAHIIGRIGGDDTPCIAYDDVNGCYAMFLRPGDVVILSIDGELTYWEYSSRL